VAASVRQELSEMVVIGLIEQLLENDDPVGTEVLGEQLERKVANGSFPGLDLRVHPHTVIGNINLDQEIRGEPYSGNASPRLSARLFARPRPVVYPSYPLLVLPGAGRCDRGCEPIPHRLRL